MRKAKPTVKKRGKTKKSFNQNHPVKYLIGSIPIRDVNVVSIYISERDMATIAEIANGSKMSVAKILAFSGQPCPACKDIPISISHKGCVVIIPRGLLSTIKNDSGSTITKKNRAV